MEPLQFARAPLEVEDLDVWFPGRTTPQLVNVSFMLRPGTVTALVGPSGAGKSTLFSAILNEITLHKGSIWIDGHQVLADQAIDPTLYSFVPQKATLRPGLTVLQTIELAAYARSRNPLSRSAMEENIRALLDDLELTGVSGNLVEKLSGGQELRVSIALELVSEPRLLILDEPTSGLDESTAEKFIETIRKVADSKGRPAILFSTHRTADLAPAHVDSVIGLGNATQSMAGKVVTTGTIRYDGPLSQLFANFRAQNLSGVNERLKSPLTNAIHVPTGHTHTRYNFTSKTLSWRRSFLYHWKIQTISLGDWNWLVGASKTMLWGIMLALALRGVSALGLAPNTEFGNQSFLVYTGLLILSLVAWGSQLPVMSLVESWEIVRREQVWGVSAKAFVWAVITRQLAELVLGVITVASVALLLADAPTDQTLLHRFGAYDTFIQLTVILLFSKMLAYCLGILIGCLNVSPVKALGQTVALSLLMLFGSGLLFKLPEFKPVYLLSFVLPSRSGIAAVASNFDAKAAMGLVSDKAFDLPEERLYQLLAFMLIVSAIALMASMVSIRRTLRLAQTRNEPGLITRLWYRFTSFQATAWLRSKKAAPVSVLLALLVVTLIANVREVESESRPAQTIAQGTPTAPPSSEPPPLDDTTAERMDPEEPPSHDTPTGNVTIREMLCPNDQSTINDWESQCSQGSSGASFMLISTGSSQESPAIPVGDGMAELSNLAEGTYRIVQSEGIWCNGTSDRVAGEAIISVVGGHTTNITIFQCNHPAGAPANVSPDVISNEPTTVLAEPTNTPAIFPLEVTPEDDPEPEGQVDQSAVTSAIPAGLGTTYFDLGGATEPKIERFQGVVDTQSSGQSCDLGGYPDWTMRAQLAEEQSLFSTITVPVNSYQHTTISFCINEDSITNQWSVWLGLSAPPSNNCNSLHLAKPGDLMPGLNVVTWEIPAECVHLDMLMLVFSNNQDGAGIWGVLVEQPTTISAGANSVADTLGSQRRELAVDNPNRHYHARRTWTIDRASLRAGVRDRNSLWGNQHAGHRHGGRLGVGNPRPGYRTPDAAAEAREVPVGCPFVVEVWNAAWPVASGLAPVEETCRLKLSRSRFIWHFAHWLDVPKHLAAGAPYELAEKIVER